MKNKFKIYNETDVVKIEHLESPRFVGDIIFGELSDIENIEWIDNPGADVMNIAKLMREAGEYIKESSQRA